MWFLIGYLMLGIIVTFIAAEMKVFIQESNKAKFFIFSILLGPVYYPACAVSAAIPILLNGIDKLNNLRKR